MKRSSPTAEPGDSCVELALLADELRVLESAINDAEIERSTVAVVCSRIHERLTVQVHVLDEMQGRWNDARATKGAER